MPSSSRLSTRKPWQTASYWEAYYQNPRNNSNNNTALCCCSYPNQKRWIIAGGFFILSVYFGFSGLAIYSLEQSTKLQQQQQQQQQQSQSMQLQMHPMIPGLSHQQHQIPNPSRPELPQLSSKHQHPKTTNVNEKPLPDIAAAQAFLKQHGPSAWQKAITAYLEPPLKDTVPETGSRGDMQKDKDHGTPPTLIQPLPLRTHTPDDLQKVEYHTTTCTHAFALPEQFPVDGGLEPSTGQPRFSNTGQDKPSPTWQTDETPYCPVNQDPFLPWIHDIFPDTNGEKIHIIAQNKRKCHTGTYNTEQVNALTPQVALLQHVSVQEITPQQAQDLAPELWQDSTPNLNDAMEKHYRLIDRASVDKGHNETRFRCQFTTPNPHDSQQMTLLAETLSEYDFNYEYASYRKTESALWTPKGKDTKLFWTSTIRFTCPVPQFLQERLAKGELVLHHQSNDDPSQSNDMMLPLLYLNLIPIRTSVRYEEQYLPTEYIGPGRPMVPAFDPVKAWGEQGHVLPHTAASGRWTNLPICPPPKLHTRKDPQGRYLSEVYPSHSSTENTAVSTNPKKPHFLSGCLWASAQFATRGVKNMERGGTTDTTERLVEWLEFHKLVGFDHFFIYDNSGAHSNSTSLWPTLQPYVEEGWVTYYSWPHQICNNNVPAHDSTGERSTQYAAENSCRTRHAPFTEWIVSFDTDEYLVPMGKHKSLKTVLTEAHEQTKTNILSFKSSRGKLREDMIVPVSEGSERRLRNPEKTFLQTYNCDGAGSPKPDWAERARKQVYLADYVLYHYVHYSTVTKGYMNTWANATKHGLTYNPRFREHAPSERPTDEIHEAVMIHSKSIKLDQTDHWTKRCKYDYEKKWQGCWIGFPWPNGTEDKSQPYRQSDGMDYNCFVNENVEKYWIPRLEKALADKKKKTQR